MFCVRRTLSRCSLPLELSVAAGHSYSPAAWRLRTTVENHGYERSGNARAAAPGRDKAVLRPSIHPRIPSCSDSSIHSHNHLSFMHRSIDRSIQPLTDHPSTDRPSIHWPTIHPLTDHPSIHPPTNPSTHPVTDPSAEPPTRRYSTVHDSPVDSPID